MRVAHARPDVGRHVFGAAAIVLGIVTLFRYDLHVILTLGNLPDRQPVVYAAAAAALAGGIAIQWRKTARAGAIVLTVLYLCFALLWIPGIIQAPLVFDRWANFFERFSILCGALIASASLVFGDFPWAARLAGIGRICFGICVVSFTVEQALNLGVTAGLVPPWMPPGQMFWAVTTTVAFALAAIAIVWGRQALLASRLLTAMLVLFVLMIWLPTLSANPRSHFIWSETVENLAILSAAWLVADRLAIR